MIYMYKIANKLDTRLASLKYLQSKFSYQKV